MDLEGFEIKKTKIIIPFVSTLEVLVDLLVKCFNTWMKYSQSISEEGRVT